MNVKELIFQEAFYQNFPLEVDKFIAYCKERGLNVNRGYLEHLEQEGHLKPIMRVDGFGVSNTTDLKELYENDQVIDPHQNGFVPWKTFYETRTEYPREVIRTYYHPYQICSLNSVLESRIRALTRFNITPQNDESVINIRKPEKYMSGYIENLIKDSKKDEKFVELLLFIQNKYLPLVKQPGHIHVTGDIYNLTNDLFEKWDDLQKKIIPKEIVIALGLETEKIKEHRGRIGIYGLSIDPLRDWYDLIKYINYDKRQKLKGNALLAQDFYLISDMLALFLEDLTGEKQRETGSILDALEGRGKVRVYGKELNYADRDILIRLLRDYGINPRPRLVLIVEGYTEEIAFPIISDAMGVPLDGFDIEIINIRGIDKHPRELIIYHSTPDIDRVDDRYCIPIERTKVFLIFDNEGNKRSWIKKFIDEPDKEIEKMMKDVLSIIKKKKKNTSANIEKIFLKHTVKCHIWNKNFEYDNFTDEELSRELNEYGEKYGYKFDARPNEIKDCRSKNRNLDEFIRTKADTSLSKTEFGEQLANLIAKEIKERTNHFENQRPVEKVLDQIIRFTVENI
ncbi:MAG: hypothetical protein CHKLHMKO_00120 [Candidatus Argoarchaeum ethanivorans]|uniref:OLD protein-like TOPRIM domain-containing protein n=1 Tax=Candidatus Argoarchaeum ethanivorans TaxID=2608793 RepID=A0A811T6Y3_9EURY|nr:MAG: hypothetical protein CHKLHMKO_00120 [Candidatus Argoarchaeum ethanivorans]